MATDVRAFTATIPAGTLATAPAFIDMSMPSRIVRSVRWRVPDGPFGTMGFALTSGQQRVIPSGSGEWIIANDEWDEVPLVGQISSGAWQLMGYNLGIYPHTVYVTFYLEPMTVAESGGALSPLAIAP